MKWAINESPGNLQPAKFRLGIDQPVSRHGDLGKGMGYGGWLRAKSCTTERMVKTLEK
jgi:hypothetical protein